jgi:hypothetical protein
MKVKNQCILLVCSRMSDNARYKHETCARVFKNCDLITCGQSLIIIVLRTVYSWTEPPEDGASRHRNVSERNSYVI